MATIDDKVVSASFESSKFESGVNATLSSLDKLKAALKFDGASKGLQDVSNAAGKVDLSHIAAGVDDIKNRLGAMRLAAVAIFAEIASKALASGEAFIKSFTIKPMLDGFKEYALTLNSVQTILANTQASGATLKDVNAALLDLNHYSDKTIYNFSQMAKNIGTFTAAGVDLKTSTQAIKGIANLAALSGSNPDQAATAMYQLSQAIAAGTVHLQDWNSVVNAGMGGTVFQRALAQTAVAMGALKEGSLKLVGPMKNVSINGESFRQSMQARGGKSWLTSKVLTTTLKQFTGDLKDGQLAAMGFKKEQIAAIQQTAKTAMLAATQVKTLGQVIDVARETAGSGWAMTWQLIFGNFGQAKTTFTGLSNTINALINKSSDARNKLLADWAALGGRKVLIDGIKIAFKNLGDILKPIKEAFREIFPATTGKKLFDLTTRFKAFAEALKPGPETVANLKRTFAGLFALLDIGKQIISGIFTVFGQLFGSMGKGSGSFLNFTGSIGDFIVSIDKALKKGNALHNFFVSLGKILSAPIQLLQAIGHALSTVFSGFSSGGILGQLDGMTKKLDPFHKILAQVGKVWNALLASIAGSGSAIKPAFDGLIQLLQGFGPNLGKALSSINFDLIFQGFRTGLLGGLLIMLRNIFGGGGFLNIIQGGLIGNITGVFNNLSSSLSSMQHLLRAKALKEIALAIALLVLSVVALSFVNPNRLTAAITAMGFMFAELLVAMKILDQVGKSGGFIKLPFIMASLILLAGAIDLLVIAVVSLSLLSWEKLAKGLGSIGVLLGMLAIAVKPLSASSGGMIRAGIGITAIAVALNLLALAVKQFSMMSWKELGKGLAGVGIGLGILVAGVNAIPSGMVLKGIGLIAVVTALKMLVGVVQSYSTMDWKAMGKGMAGMGAGLVIIALAMHLMPSNLPIIALGLWGVSTALFGITKAVKSMAGMSVRELATGLIGLAGSLVVLAGGLYLMSGSLAGATALAVAAAGLSLLIPPLILLGKQSWQTILTGLLALAGAFAVLGVAGMLLTPTIPVMLGFGAAMLLIGAGLALAGVGILAIGTGLAALAVAGPAGVGILIAALDELVAAIPRMAKNFVLGLLAIVDQLAATAPKFVDALIKILNSLLDAIIQASPKIAIAFDALIALALKVIADNQPKIIQAGFNLILGLLHGISNNIGKIVTAVGDILVKFLNAIANNLGRVIIAGSNILIAVLKGIASGYANVITAGLTIITKLLGAIASNLGKVATAGLSILTKLLQAISDGLSRVITAGTNVIVHFVTGIGNAGARIITAGTNSIIKLINALSSNSVKLANAGAQAIINFLNGVAAAINSHAGEMQAAGARVGIAIINGMTGGLLGKAQDLYNKVGSVMHKAMGLLHSIPGVKSPSTVTHDIGVNIIQGLINGMDSSAPGVYASAEGMSNGLIKKFNDVFQISSPSKVMVNIGQAVGQGFAQGIRGSADNIKSAFTDLNSKLVDAMTSTQDTIKSENEKLKKLQEDLVSREEELAKAQAAKKPNAGTIARIQGYIKDDAEAIKKVQGIIAENQNVLDRLTAGHTVLIKTLKSNRIELIGLSIEYDKISEKLKKAQTALQDAKKVQDDALASYKSQYSSGPGLSDTLVPEIKSAREAIAAEQKKYNELFSDPAKVPTIEEIAAQQAALDAAKASLSTLVEGKVLDAAGNSVDQLATYLQALENQTSAVGAYSSTLEQLRKLGLDDATYQKLLTEGTADQSFASQLLAGGKTAVTSLNTLDTQLMTVSTTLATNAAKNLYQAGVDAAQGLVNGLESKKSAIRKKMEEIAEEMLRALRKKLKMKSPSEAFSEIGTLAMEGMAQGFSNSSKVVTDSIDAAAQDALAAMRKSMSDISTVITDELNTNPTITPILDLTDVRNKANELAVLTNGTPFIASASFGQASTISSEQAVIQADQVSATSAGTSVTFEQNNYSPEALSDITIYRQTKNQLSQLKSVLGVT